MNYEKGAFITCDRCGKKAFLKYLKTEEFDGGWTLVDAFEKPPEGWKEIMFQYQGVYQHMLFCDFCKSLFDEVTARYEAELKEENLVKMMEE